MAKSRSNKKQNKVRRQKLPISNQPLKKYFFKRFVDLSYLNKIYIVALGLITLVGSIPTYNFIKEKYFLSGHDKFMFEKYKQGYLVSPAISGNEPVNFTISDTPPNFHVPKLSLDLPKIKGIKLIGTSKIKVLGIALGNSIIILKISDLEKGIALYYPDKLTNPNFKLTLVVKYNRLFVSTEFKDLQKEETVGFIEFNHWNLLKSNMVDYHDSDEKLEVIDKQSNIVFSITFSSPRTVEIQGYFISPDYVVVANHTSGFNSVLKTNPSWKTIAMTWIVKTKSIF